MLWQMQPIHYELKPKRRREPFRPSRELPFGKQHTDHAFMMEYSEGEWHSPRIVPEGRVELSPRAVVFHYGQTIFEGMKAFQHADGELYLFRPEEHARRFNTSADIMVMPSIPLEDQLEAIKALADVERQWYPQMEGGSLYIRPVMWGTEESLRVKESETYQYCILVSPVQPYFSQGFQAGTLMITDQFHRAVPGGTGKAKTGGNYGASLRAMRRAKAAGADQVLYLDVSNTFLDEAGAMNHFQVTSRGEIIIPEFTETILESITARSMLALGKQLQHPVRQERISLEDFLYGIKEGEIVEAGGLGTAAGVFPVGKYLVSVGRDRKELERVVVGKGTAGEVSRKMYGLLQGIQRGRMAAPPGWMEKVTRKV